ncbi:MAG: DUF4199 domain-containing protein [Gemmatirosa sp.]|nr:DUF4199 domain-containing protein [Gemmatirosa sp.]
MRKTVLTFGLISGIVMSAMLLLTMPFQARIGFEAGAVIGYATMVAASLLVYFGARRYRDTVAGGSVSFGRAFAVGALIAVVAGACYTATWEAIYARIGPEFDARYRAHALERAQAHGATPAELARKKADLDEFAAQYHNVAINAAMTFLEPLPVGLIAALVSAGLLRRRRSGQASADFARVS